MWDCVKLCDLIGRSVEGSRNADWGKVVES